MEIKTSYTSLRRTADRIIDLVSRMSGVDKEEISIQSAINNDLGVDGDDWTDLQQVLQNEEGLCLEGLSFYNYFMDEGQIADPGGCFIELVPFAWYVISLKWLKMHFGEYHQPPGPPNDVLTIGDLITSTYEGRFIKRTDRKFVFS